MSDYIINSVSGTGVNAYVFRDLAGAEWIVFGVGLAKDVTAQAERYGYADNLEAFRTLVNEMAERVANEADLELTDETVFLKEGSVFNIEKEVDIPDPTFLQAITGQTKHLLQRVV